MKVAILTMFNGLSPTYSLVNVVADHVRMLLDHGISVKILVCEDCPDEERRGIFADERLEWVKITNRLNGAQIHWYDYAMAAGEVHSTFEEESELIAADFRTHLHDIDVCMIHDIHYQGWHLIHNVALCKAQKTCSEVRFIAMTHSAPVNRPANPQYPFSCRYTAMPNTLYAYPTYSGISALAKQYQVPEGKCRVIYNSLDSLSFLSEEVQLIHQQSDLLRPDILIVYPARLTTGKKFEKVAALAGAIRKKTEQSVKVVFCDFPCLDIEASQYKYAIRKIGIFFGLEDTDMVFTSDLNFPNGFPRKSVLDLFTLSNLFICPSYSESFGLTVLEAAGRGNFLVLNEAVPALKELGEKLNAYFMRWDARNFGFDTQENYQPNEQSYLETHAGVIVNQMRDNAVLHAKTVARQKLNPDWVFYHQLQPLLEK
ncbi:MAG: glycosyltransferase [Evtepia sp.]